MSSSLLSTVGAKNCNILTANDLAFSLSNITRYDTDKELTMELVADLSTRTATPYRRAGSLFVENYIIPFLVRIFPDPD